MNKSLSKPNIWLHGSQINLTSLNDMSSVGSDYCNSGLGLFLTKNKEIAASYANNGYVIELEVDLTSCLVCNDNEFWCVNESTTEEDLDPLGNYINPPGSKSRMHFLKCGYTTLIYNDEKEMGEVLVVLDYKAAKIINFIKVISNKMKL